MQSSQFSPLFKETKDKYLENSNLDSSMIMTARENNRVQKLEKHNAKVFEVMAKKELQKLKEKELSKRFQSRGRSKIIKPPFRDAQERRSMPLAKVMIHGNSKINSSTV